MLDIFKIALPKGRLLRDTARLLEKAGWSLEGYNDELRSYRIKSLAFPGVLLKVFHEKDIPIQVAVGNYDLGICGSDWVEELLAKYPSAAIVKLRSLGFGFGSLYTVGKRLEPAPAETPVRLASEYPNLAESFALQKRLRRFSIYPLWGAAEAYPPDLAELALVAGRAATGERVLDFSACLIANRRSWETRDLSAFIGSLNGGLAPMDAVTSASPAPDCKADPACPESPGAVRLALPDGHQQQPTIDLLHRAGIDVQGYPAKTGDRRPVISLEGVSVKVIRPQDMPLQVANGNFDLAITGRDWLTEHLDQFPTSPVMELADLKFGWVKLVAVAANDVPASDIRQLRELYDRTGRTVRVASEYVNIADRYARDNRLGRYRIIPTWGATEAFLPEDADLLIENTQTGGTIARHNLKIIDTLFESTAYLVGNRQAAPVKAECINLVRRRLAAAVELKS